jgi:hypothetical protein
MKHSIAVFIESYSNILIFLNGFESPKFASIPYLIYYETVGSPTEDYGKKDALFGFRKRPQDVVVNCVSPQPTLWHTVSMAF